MKICILGDTHGEWSAANRVIGKAIGQHPDITHIVQVGDFGYAWPGTKPLKLSRGFFTDEQLEKLESIPKLWLDGNHENYTKLVEDCGAWQPGWTWMPRGEILEVDGYRMMFFGGAMSHDRGPERLGIDWWPDERISYGQISAALEKPGPIDAIFSHDHPACIPYSDKHHKGDQTVVAERESLQALCDKFNPDFWFFGHHHRGDHGVVDEMQWTCCPIIDNGAPPCYTIWTGTSVDRYWQHDRRSRVRDRPDFIC